MRQMRQMGEQGLQKEREQDLEMEGVGETGPTNVVPSGGMAVMPWRAGSPPLNKVLWLLFLGTCQKQERPLTPTRLDIT